MVELRDSRCVFGTASEIVVSQNENETSDKIFRAVVACDLPIRSTGVWHLTVGGGSAEGFEIMNYCKTREDFLKYAEQLYERQRQHDEFELSKPVDMTELLEMKFPFEHAVDGETDYRRGFTHGFSFALSLFDEIYRKGYVRPTEIGNILNYFFDQTLMRWRYNAHADVVKGIRCKFTEGHPKFTIRPWKEVREIVFQRDFNRCSKCGSGDELQCDHVIPVCGGGLPTIDNLQTLCAWCNRSKGGSQ